MRAKMKKMINKVMGGVLLLAMTLTMNVNASTSEAEFTEIMENTDPKLMVSSYEIVEGQTVGGEEFTMKVNVVNTNQYADAMNVMVTYTSDTDNVRLVDCVANQHYEAFVGAGESFSFLMEMEAMDVYEMDAMVMTFQFTYYDKNGVGYQNASMITPKIYKSCEMEINSLNVADTAMVGANSLVNLRYSSTGKLPIASAAMIIEGDISESGKEIALEGIADSEQKSFDYYVDFLSEGEQTLSISFKYQDEDGREYVIKPQEFKVVVSPYQSQVTNVSQVGKSNLVTDENEVYFLAGSIAIIVAVVAVAAIFAVKGKKK